MTHRRTTIGSHLAASALVIALGSGLAACGSDDPVESATTSATAATSAATGDEEEEGEYEIVSDTDVAAGLANTITTLTSLSAAPATATDEAISEVFEDWESYEGTVKQNDANTYLALEDALGAFKKGAEASDQAALAAALADFTTAASAYLTSYPG